MLVFISTHGIPTELLGNPHAAPSEIDLKTGIEM